MFPILFWLISAVAILLYLIFCPTAPSWTARVVFDGTTLVLLVLAYLFIASPGHSSAENPSELAEAARWQPYLHTVYFSSLSIIILGIASTIRYYLFGGHRDSDRNT